jgi:hypothetical protein
MCVQYYKRCVEQEEIDDAAQWEMLKTNHEKFLFSFLSSATIYQNCDGGTETRVWCWGRPLTELFKGQDTAGRPTEVTWRVSANQWPFWGYDSRKKKKKKKKKKKNNEAFLRSRCFFQLASAIQLITGCQPREILVRSKSSGAQRDDAAHGPVMRGAPNVFVLSSSSFSSPSVFVLGFAHFHHHQ